MRHYVIYKIETTPARLSIDGKNHTHKYYFYPIPSNLKQFGFGSNWSYQNGRRGAVKFTDKREAQRIAKHYGAQIEEVRA